MSERADRDAPATLSFAVPPIVKVVDVQCPPQAAFDLFAREIGRWWPLATHSLGGASASHCAIEPRVGGRVYERESNGRQHLWGSVLEWQEAKRLVFTWHVGRAAADAAQTVALTFTPSADGTRVELVHSGWETLGADAEAARRSYDAGWGEVFVERFGGHARRASQ